MAGENSKFVIHRTLTQKTIPSNIPDALEVTLSLVFLAKTSVEEQAFVG